MIRVVAFRKAFLAGAAGALAWEAILRLGLWLGLPLVDLVRTLGTLLVSPDVPAAWWIAGLVLHLTVGALAAVIYAYLFWSSLPGRPVLQGLAFGLAVAVPLIGVLYPLLLTLHAPSDVLPTSLWDVSAAVRWHERGGLLLGSLIYGGALGALYRRPVGNPIAKPVQLPAPSGAPRHVSRRVAPRGPGAFIFATGVENSYPTLWNGRWRRDEMASTGHYAHWERDLDLAAEVGVSHLRWGPPLYLANPARGRFDWDWTEQVLARMAELGIEPIVDLCHFGLPTWLGDFQNEEVPHALADYAAAFARRFPRLRFYTPVNEMYVTARLSALEGAWNEQRRDERAFVRATCNLVSANKRMVEEILRVRSDAVLVNSESGEFYQPCCPDPKIVHEADFENERRFLALDLLYARPVSDEMRGYLFDHGLARDEYAWFMADKAPRRSIVGVDYYEWNEKLIDTEGKPRSLGELFGWYVIAKQYYDRYQRPMMHTETNRMDARDAPRWLWRQWHNVRLMQKAGVPLIGFTWYSLTDQVDWDIALRDARGNVNPVGLFDLNRQPRAVGQAYRYLIETNRDQPELCDYPPLRALLN